MSARTTIVMLLILAASFQASSQTPHEFKKLAASPYILLAEVVDKPADTIKWVGAFKYFWIKPLKDYKGNFAGRPDSVAVLIDLKDTHDISLWPHLKKGDELMVFITGTSLGHAWGSYYSTVGDNALGHRVGSHDGDVFRIGSSVITRHEFKNCIDSINRRDNIEKKHHAALQRYGLSDWSSLGDTRLWSGQQGNGVYADGVYVAYWEARGKYIRHVYTLDKKGRMRVFVKDTDDKVIAHVRRFLAKQDCSTQELQECLTEVSFHLDNRTNEWSTSWGSAQRK